MAWHAAQSIDDAALANERWPSSCSLVSSHEIFTHMPMTTTFTATFQTLNFKLDLEVLEAHETDSGVMSWEHSAAKYLVLKLQIHLIRFLETMFMK
jgi:hypothetical protein